MVVPEREKLLTCNAAGPLDTSSTACWTGVTKEAHGIGDCRLDRPGCAKYPWRLEHKAVPRPIFAGFSGCQAPVLWVSSPNSLANSRPQEGPATGRDNKAVPVCSGAAARTNWIEIVLSMTPNLDSQARPRQAWTSLEAEWPPGKRERLLGRLPAGPVRNRGGGG